MIIRTKTAPLLISIPAINNAFQIHPIRTRKIANLRCYSTSNNLGDVNNGNPSMNATEVSVSIPVEMDVEKDMIVENTGIQDADEEIKKKKAIVGESFMQSHAQISELEEMEVEFLNVPSDKKEVLGIGSENMTESKASRTAIDLDSTRSSSVRGILKFAIPAVGVWLCSPLLSLIDTSAVGLLSGTSNQAALSPATTLTDYSALLLAFLFTATTNLSSSAITADRKELDKTSNSAAKTLISSINFSAFVGTGLGTLLFLSAGILLRGIMGIKGSANLDVFYPALRYVRIRSLGMPAAAIIGSAQAACLGMKDVNAPLFVLLTAALVNLFGDVLLVGQKHPWIGGTSGAAWATVISQYVAVAFFFRWFLDKNEYATKNNISDKPRDNTVENTINISDGILNLSDKRLDSFKDCSFEFNSLLEPSSNISKAKRMIKGLAPKRKPRIKKNRHDTKTKFTTRGFLDGHFKKRSVLRVPRKPDIMGFKPYIIPCTMTGVGRVSTYIAMNFVVANALSTTDMAAQVIILSFFNCICMLADALNMTAQSFVPTVFEQTKSIGRLNALKKMTRDFAKASSIFGIGMVGIVATIPFLVKCFTNDPIVVSTANSIVPLLMINFAVHGFVCAGEGVLLGQKDLTFLGRAFATFFAVVPWIMIQTKNWLGKSLTLIDLWKVFVVYNTTRCSIWILRILLLEKRTESEIQA